MINAPDDPPALWARPAPCAGADAGAVVVREAVATGAVAVGALDAVVVVVAPEWRVPPDGRVLVV